VGADLRAHARGWFGEHFAGGRNMKFTDRRDAGRRLAAQLAHLKEQRPVILALPRGGVAVGFAMRVALQAVRRRNPARLVLAVPVGPPETIEAFGKEADEVVCPETPPALGAIGLYYRDFHQMSDAEVIDLLARAARMTVTPSPSASAQ